MSSRNIAVQKGVYDALVREKRGSESFTKVLGRLLSQRGPLDDLVGVWPQRTPTIERRMMSHPVDSRRRGR